MKKSYCVLLVVILVMVAMDMKHKDEIMARRDENVIAQVAFVWSDTLFWAGTHRGMHILYPILSACDAVYRDDGMKMYFLLAL